MKELEVAIVGMGTMGTATEELFQKDYGITGIRRGDSLAQISEADIVVLAVKPQTFNAGLGEELWPHVTDRQRIVSIMAGITTQRLCNTLGTEHVVRAMPNATKGLIAWYTEDENADDQAFFDHWRTNVRLEREEQFAKFTAIGGSGPAFLLLVAEVMQEELEFDGHGADQSQQIVATTLQAAADMARRGKSLRSEIAKIASRGGTTAAGLEYAEMHDFRDIVRGVIRAAEQRSKELGSD